MLAPVNAYQLRLAIAANAAQLAGFPALAASLVELLKIELARHD